MPHCRNSCCNDSSHPVGHNVTAFQLDGVTTGFSHKSSGVKHCGFCAGLIGHVGHISYQKSCWSTPPDCLGMADHVIHGHRKSPVISEHGHSQAVSHQDHVHLGLFLEISRRVIITSQPGNRFPLGSFIKQGSDGHFFSFSHLKSSGSEIKSS